jgi:hypothetical protein
MADLTVARVLAVIGAHDKGRLFECAARTFAILGHVTGLHQATESRNAIL